MEDSSCQWRSKKFLGRLQAYLYEETQTAKAFDLMKILIQQKKFLDDAFITEYIRGAGLSSGGKGVDEIWYEWQLEEVSC